MGTPGQSGPWASEDEEDGAAPPLEDDLAADDGVPDDDPDATRAGPPLKLEIVAGPDAGRVRRFRGVRMVLGRAPGVDLRLSDTSVSRRHVELVRGEAGVLLRDLGSGNGTRVNGELVAERRLAHGDEIALGTTRIRLHDEAAAFRQAREAAAQEAAAEQARLEAGAQAAAAAARAAEEAAARAEEPTVAMTAPAPAMAPPAWRRRGVALAAGGAVVLLLAAGALLLRGPPAPDPARAAGERKLELARAALKGGDPEVAVRLVDEAERLAPGVDRERLGIHARDELAFFRGLGEALAHLEAQRFAEVRSALARLGPGTPRGEAGRAELEAQLALAEAAARQDRLQALLAGGELELARQQLAQLPPGERPEATRQLEETERLLAARQAEAQAEGRRQAAAAAAARRSQREEAVAAAFSTVERKFAQEEWERAASECSRVLDAHAGDAEIEARARLLRVQIPAFGQAHEEGMKKYRQKLLVQAARPLQRAWSLYGQLHLQLNQLGPPLAQALGEALPAAAREALLRDDLATAAQSLRDLKGVPGEEARAAPGLAELEARAQAAVEAARALDPGDAARRLELVLQATEAGSPAHGRAAAALKGLAERRP